MSLEGHIENGVVVSDAQTADEHFDQVGFQALLRSDPDVD